MKCPYCKTEHSNADILGHIWECERLQRFTQQAREHKDDWVAQQQLIKESIIASEYRGIPITATRWYTQREESLRDLVVALLEGNPSQMTRADIVSALDTQHPTWRRWEGYPWGCASCGYVEVRAIDEHTENRCPSCEAAPPGASRITDSARASIRTSAAYSLGELLHVSRDGTIHPNATDVIPALEIALTDPSRQVQGFAIQALGNIQHPSAIPSLERVLENAIVKGTPDPEQYYGPNVDESIAIASRAAQALGSIGDPSSVPALERAARMEFPVEEGKRLRERAIWALGYMKAREAIPTIGWALNDDSKSVCYSAIHSLGQVGGPDAVNILRNFYMDFTPVTSAQNYRTDLSYRIVESTGRFVTPDSSSSVGGHYVGVGVLIAKGLGDSRGKWLDGNISSYGLGLTLNKIRQAIVKALEEMGQSYPIEDEALLTDPRYLPSATGLLREIADHDPTPYIRRMAFEAINKIQEQRPTGNFIIYRREHWSRSQTVNRPRLSRLFGKTPTELPGFITMDLWETDERELIEAGFSFPRIRWGEEPEFRETRIPGTIYYGVDSDGQSIPIGYATKNTGLIFDKRAESAILENRKLFKEIGFWYVNE